jgi:outer membrane protein assembly factor BamB
MRIAVGLLAIVSAIAGNWPQWRGPSLNGTSDEKNLPVHWSQETNVVWKLAMPSWSGSTPIVWGNRIFLNVAEGRNLELWCVDASRGSVLWKRHLSGGNVKMRKQNMSSPSPVTDGTNVWAMTGTGILKAFDYEGKELWSRDIQKEYGQFGLYWGYASSPLLHEDSLYVQVLHGMKTDDPSYVLRIDKTSGRTVWRVERPTKAIHESPDAYTTPTLVRNGAAAELVVSGGDVATGHDLTTGKELWRAGGFNPTNNPSNRVIASPLAYGNIVYVPTLVKPLQAFRAGGRGDITKSHLVFQFHNGPDIPSPVTDGTYFYSINDRGIVYCLDSNTGQQVYGGQRLKPGTYTASPVLADGKIYVTNEEGLTTVIKAGPKFEILAENALNDYVLSSPAISNGRLYLRTTGYLYTIGATRAR